MKLNLHALNHWDVLWFTNIFGLNSRGIWPSVFPLVSRSADGYLYPLAALLLVAIAPDKAAPFFYAALLAFGLDIAIYKLVKNLVKRDRPFKAIARVRNRVVPTDQFSFPSGHTAAAFVFATLLGNFFPLLAPVLFLWASAVGFSRVFLGVHYPSDILAGCTLGYGCAHIGLLCFA